MKYIYRFVMDTGKNVIVQAKTRTAAIEQYCKDTGVDREWLKKHCRVVNLGRADHG